MSDQEEAHMSVSSPVLSVEDLSVTFARHGRDLPVLRGVSLQVRPGEAYGLVGESGCGKSTLALASLRYLARNGRVDGGRILLDGEDIVTMQEDRLTTVRGTKIGMVYQDPGSALNPSIRIGDQVAEVFEFQARAKRAEAFERARASLERVALPDPGDVMRRYPFELSGGQQQRVVIAMALAGDPHLLILDEPTTGLDATVEAEVLDLIQELRDEIDAAVLLISHNLGTVARLCERVGVMYAGRILEEGSARELFTDPRHPYTRGLLRCVPRFGARKDQVCLMPIPGSVPALGTPMPGCVFAGRCGVVRPECSERAPQLAPLAEDAGAAEAVRRRAVRCFCPDQAEALAAEGPRACANGGFGEPLLEVRDLVKEFRDGPSRLVAVDGVSIEVRAGETLGLVGESGSGKTTLANCIVGLLEPSGGEIVLQGQKLRPAVSMRTKEALRAIQMVFQNPDSTLNPSWSTRTALNRAVRRVTKLSGSARRERVDQLARDVQFEPRYLEAKPKELSGGQKQRLAIARAFAGSPRLVLCDEPASALDVSVQATILNLLADLQAEKNVAYLLISHDLAVVRYLSDRIAVMYLGGLVEIGEAEAVFGAVQHPYTEALTSAIPTLDFDKPSRRIPLQGPPPSLKNPPPGCRFQTRCHTKIGERCEREAPLWRDAGRGHLIRCHIELDELADRQRERREAVRSGD
jgi:peptide/nickel transport system ATP-binding protein